MTGEPDQRFAREDIFQQAATLHEQGKLDRAERLYRAILDADPADIGSLHNLGILCIQQGRCDEAAKLLSETLRQKPDLAPAHNTLGVALRHLGRLAEAESCFREALRLIPTYAEAHNSLGDALTALGRFAEAEAHCREALRLVPTYAEAHNNLAADLLSLGRPHEAEICCREALRLKPGNPAAHHNLFITLYQQQGIGEIAALLGRSMLLKPDFLSALLFLLGYVISGDIGFAAGIVIVIAAGLVRFEGIKLPGRTTQPMRWLRFALVLVLGSLTILTQIPRFLMAEPSVVHFAVAGLMLRQDGVIRYIAPIARQEVPERVTAAAGYAWASLNAALGLANLIIALYFDLTTWAWFVSIGAIGTKALRYAMFRTIVKRRFVQFQRSTLDNLIDGHREMSHPETIGAETRT
jgi:Flp pilus assembly protein TadD/intracellular septation protein A